ncbi:MAG: hypothetical protein RLZZ611_1827 [Cyanobacteriota bacterium]|jgi:hypothetical protein
MAHRRLKLSLSAGESLPTSLNWMIEAGYVVLISWNDEESPATLGIWGPGELVIPSLPGGRCLQLLALSAVKVQEWTPSAEERQQVLSQQVLQLVKLLELSRIRRAEVRLYSLLLWLGERFGRVSKQGVCLSFNAMNLTHRNLAEITGMTRVTVTKSLIRFRQEGWLSKQGHDELLQRKDTANPASG